MIQFKRKMFDSSHRLLGQPLVFEVAIEYAEVREAADFSETHRKRKG